MKIGIPKSLIYWKKPYFWETFFTFLGFNIVFSPNTNKEIVELGTKISDPETCFSNKVYFGHLKWLDGKCDLIFVPRLKSNIEKLEYCPKFFGLPDLAKVFIKTKILSETFDERKTSLEESVVELGKKLSKNEKETRKALFQALLEEEMIKAKEGKRNLETLKSKKQKIVLISHPYNLYDEYVNLKVKEKLKKLGTEPIFIDQMPTYFSYPSDEKIHFHWEFGNEIMLKIEEALRRKIAGAIQISSFACGCDAVLKEFIEKKFNDRKIPYLYLIIDEHTGEAGFQTRVEAFLDTIKL